MARFPLDLCWCGRVRGVASDVSPSSGFRFICYCKDCQAFARFLERPDVLDRAGGTDIFQMPAGRVKLTAGTDAVRCLRLSSEGVLRWYTTAASPGFPVIAVVHSFMAHAADGRSREEALGLPICRIYERSAVGPLPANAPARAFGEMVAFLKAHPSIFSGRRLDELIEINRQVVACMLSGTSGYRPVIVGWSTANRPLMPKPINHNRAAHHRNYSPENLRLSGVPARYCMMVRTGSLRTQSARPRGDQPTITGRYPLVPDSIQATIRL